MGRVCVFFAEGFEEIEALTVVDILRRGGVDVDMVSVTGEKSVTGSHRIAVEMDKLLEEVDFEKTEMLVLPGGMPGTKGLEATAPLMEQVDAFYEKGKYIAAICAAPGIFGHRGILKGRKACSNPSFESHLEGAEVSKEPVTVSDNVITSRGMGTAIPFGLKLLEQLAGEEAALEMKEKIVFNG
ncbi:MAG: DJ-1/PfpI family protein [Blautia sp.]|nr:DJ-1/PfpI family protein [Blautia sp.]MCM1200744.1 DJ-1/PfpI family protein [Bacteroides fragilis]